jgi:hypothetical protein
MMKPGFILGVAVVAATFASVSAAQAQNNLKECAAQWNAAKAANQTEGKTYREFQKTCLSKAGDTAKPASATATTPPPAAAAKPAPAVAAKPAPVTAAKPAAATAAKPDVSNATTAKTPSPGREALTARERACGAEWKADKAAGKIAAGMKWPQYWSACNTRKKAEGT